MNRIAVVIAISLAVALAMWATAPASGAVWAAQGMAASASDSQSVTGCLKKGHEPGGFYLAGEHGKTYELSGDVNFAEHVGHKVTATGSVVEASKEKEAEIGKSEKKEASGKGHKDMHVTDLKMVSDSCK